MIVFLDMDGVIVDAHKAFLRQLGREDMLEKGAHPPGVWDLCEVLGMDPKEFWARIELGGSEFWADMEPLPWAEELYNGLLGIRGVVDVIFCSKPTRDPECLKGKLQWLKKFTGMEDFGHYIFTASKELLASGEGRLLIDDRPENCDEFRWSGGRAIQFPAKWAGWSETEISAVVKYLLGDIEREAGG